MPKQPLYSVVILAALLLPSGCKEGSTTASEVPPNMFPVTPTSSRSSQPPAEPPAPSAAGLPIAQGQFFSYALPQGWRLGEDGQFALSLIAPDNKALTLMVGNAGFPLHYPPGQFVYDKLMVLGPQNLQMSQPRPAAPVPGFSHAFAFDVAYVIQGIPCRGLVKCHVAPSYDSCVMAMTAALADASQWPHYASWLPLVSEQISATNGAAFGMRGIMQQNLQNSTAYAAAAREYRAWSQRTQQETTDHRNQSVDRRNFEVRENLGGVQTYTNPYDTRQPVELPGTYQYYWVSPQGQILGTDDPRANPNAGGTGEWSQMPRHRP